jgi:hypothetical protein
VRVREDYNNSGEGLESIFSASLDEFRKQESKNSTTSISKIYLSFLDRQMSSVEPDLEIAPS